MNTGAVIILAVVVAYFVCLALRVPMAVGFGEELMHAITG